LAEIIAHKVGRTQTPTGFTYQPSGWLASSVLRAYPEWTSPNNNIFQQRGPTDFIVVSTPMDNQNRRLNAWAKFVHSHRTTEYRAMLAKELRSYSLLA